MLHLFIQIPTFIKRVVSFRQVLLPLFLVSYCLTNSFAQLSPGKENSLVQKFYAINHETLIWFSSEKNLNKAVEWLKQIESTENPNILVDKSRSIQIRAKLLGLNTKDNILKDTLDQQITGIILNFLKDLQQGNVKFDYDEVCRSHDSVYFDQLVHFQPQESVSSIISRLECKDHDYMVLKKYLNDSISTIDGLNRKKIVLAMNYRKYFTINHQTEFIVVNIPATDARYYRNDLLKITMRTVVGMRKHPSPTIASYITNIVTFPHWNVPHSIAVGEILPKVQKSENYLEQNNYEVVNGKGKVIEDSELNWQSYTEKNFPYFFRQATGSRNALGVLKFNLQNPFSIFLHSTSNKGAFAKYFRFLSHGCIRLQKPLELAKALLPDKIDIKELKSGKKDTESKTIKLSHNLPVFIIYVPVSVVGNKVVFFKDEYGLIQ